MATVWTPTATTANRIWNTWVTTSTTASVTLTLPGSIVWHNWQVEQQTNDELQARREQESRERLARRQRQHVDWEAAKARALELLTDLLTERERASLEESARIEIEGRDGNLYRLETHRETVHGNIVKVDEHGCVLGRACLAPSMYEDGRPLPTADGWVGQYLGLKFDTEEFLSHANWSGIRPCDLRAAA